MHGRCTPRRHGSLRGGCRFELDLVDAHPPRTFHRGARGWRHLPRHREHLPARQRQHTQGPRASHECSPMDCDPREAVPAAPTGHRRGVL